MVGVTANLGESSLSSRAFAGGVYFARRHLVPPERAWLDWPATAKPRPAPREVTVAQRRGLRFEQKVTAAFGARYGSGWLPQPCFGFSARHEVSRAIPDGLLFSRQEIIAIEIKYNFRREALAQLEDFYLPIVRLAFPRHVVSGMVVCRNILDPLSEAERRRMLYDVCDLTGLRARTYTQLLLVGAKWC